MADTASPLPITTRSDGSKGPVTSRKATTLWGSAMPEIRSPKPNTRPQANAANAFIGLPSALRASGQFALGSGPSRSSQDMPQDIHARHACAHEAQGCDDRTRRQARDTADPVAARAARAVARTDADDESRKRDHRQRNVEPDGRHRVHERI